jgi:hypothetical protein
MKDDKAQPIGEVLKGFMDNVISERQKSCSQLMEVWSRILPHELLGHCEIVEFTSGVIKVKTDGPGFRHELWLCRKELIRELNRNMTGARVRDIQLSI